MSEELPPVRCDDPSTWRHKGHNIGLPRLLKLIQENGGAWGLDLHGCNMLRIDARPEALVPYVDDYRKEHGLDATPPWLSETGGIDLCWAHLEDAVLEDAHLERARLDGAHLQYANLCGVHLEDGFLHGARLEHAALAEAHLDNANLRRAHLDNVDLVGARLHGAFLYEAYLNRTRVRRDSLGKAIGDELGARDWSRIGSQFHDAREAYLALKTNFDSIGRYEDASWAYVKEQQMEKAMHFPTSPGQWWLRGCMGGTLPPPWWGPRRLPAWLWWKLRSAFYNTRLFLGLCPRGTRQLMARRTEGPEAPADRLSRWRWARNWLYEATTQYGENPWRPLLWAMAVVVSFTLGYSAAGNVASGDSGGTHNFLTALTHSIGAFATIGFNTLEPQGWGARLLTAIEAMLGIGLFALFVFTLGNRMRRS